MILQITVNVYNSRLSYDSLLLFVDIIIPPKLLFVNNFYVFFSLRVYLFQTELLSDYFKLNPLPVQRFLRQPVLSLPHVQYFLHRLQEVHMS